MSSPTTGRAFSPILLIEDETSVSAFVRAALERRGYTVVQAGNGEEGLRQLAKGMYAGVITDIRMPG
ncbi:MAG TPA: response regulator, partial [Candidatus Dormibacteraeota bacterium]|nr:response regulator [Candidatus Dormibacteraeota bacterium]